MYTIRNYQKGYEESQFKIGQDVARHWVWPYAYDLEDLLAIHAQPDFDPETRHYCFDGKEMVGYTFSVIKNAGMMAELDFPRMLPGHEPASYLLIEKAIETLIKRGVKRIEGIVSTMDPVAIELAKQAGFSIRDWGFKKYYSYEMAWGTLSVPGCIIGNINPQTDIDECAELAALWYKRPLAWCRSHLEEWYKLGVIAHVGIWEAGKLTAACMAARNQIRPSTAGIYYIHVQNEAQLKALLGAVVEQCVGCSTKNVIADLQGEHRQFESIYQELGFETVTEWGICEKEI